MLDKMTNQLNFHGNALVLHVETDPADAINREYSDNAANL